MLQYCFCFMFWFWGCEAWRILVPSPGIEPAFPCMGRWSLKHWTAREVPCNYWAKALVSINQLFTCSHCLPLPHLASMVQADNVNCLTGCCISPEVSLYLVLIWVESVCRLSFYWLEYSWFIILLCEIMLYAKCVFKTPLKGFPWWSNGWNSMLLMHRTRV